MKNRSGSVFGGILLICGSCVGAGMLGLPVTTGIEGFAPSLLMFIVACTFMTATGLLLVDVSAQYEKPVHFITMVTDILGPLGRVLCWLSYLFLFYALLTAYVALSGVHFAQLFTRYSPFVLNPWMGSVFFVGLFCGVVYMGTRTVDLWNRVLMFAKIISYFGLLIVGFSFVQPVMLEYMDFRYVAFSLPILIISFGFHNMIPTLFHYLGGEVRRVKISIIGGAALTFLIYLFWQALVLGTVPIDGEYGILSSYRLGIDAVTAMNRLLRSPWIFSFASLLAFFAILTSFLAQSLSLVHFLADGMSIPREKREHVGICLLTFLPPLVAAIVYPDVFYRALNFAGGVCTVVLFGIFPVLMAWIQRRVHWHQGALVVIFLIATFVLVNQLSQLLGHPFFLMPEGGVG